MTLEAGKEEGARLWKVLHWVTFSFTFWAWVIMISPWELSYVCIACNDPTRRKMVALFYFSLVDSSFKIVFSSVQQSEGVITKKGM